MPFLHRSDRHFWCIHRGRFFLGSTNKCAKQHSQLHFCHGLIRLNGARKVESSGGEGRPEFEALGPMKITWLPFSARTARTVLASLQTSSTMTGRCACTIRVPGPTNLTTQKDKAVPSELIELPALSERLRPGERLLGLDVAPEPLSSDGLNAISGIRKCSLLRYTYSPIPIQSLGHPPSLRSYGGHANARVT